MSKDSPHKEELRLTFGRYPSGTKIVEEETGSNPYCSAAAESDPQASRAWSGPQQSYSRGARQLEGKVRNRNNFIINKLDIHIEPHLKVSNYKDGRWINGQRWEETSAKRMKTLETRTTFLLQGITTPHKQGNKA